MLEKLQAFWVAWGPWIGLSLIPTLIAGLSKSPKTKPAANFIEKLWNTVKNVMAFLSFATHKDEPGTFKLPLTPPKKAAETVAKVATILLVIGTTLGCGSCGPIKDMGDKTKQAIIDCTTEAVKANAAHLLPVITAIITSSAPNWKEMLTAFAKELGRDAVACALQTSALELQAKVPAAGPAGNPEAQAALASMQKARLYISEQGWQFKAEQ